MSSQNAPTIETIARQMNVSQSTVSRALRNDPRIAELTRERIFQEAQRLGYRPNPLVSALMTQLRTNRPAASLSTIAYLDTFQRHDEWKLYPTTRKLWQGASERADELGHRLERFWFYEPGISPARLRSILLARGIYALIVKFNPPKENMEHGLPFDFGPFVTATVEFRMSKPATHATTNDQFQSTLLGLRSLHDLDYKRIGLVVSAYNNNAFDFRISGAYHVYQQTIPAKNRLPIHSLPEPQWNKEHFAAWYKAQRPDALLVFGTETREWMRELGLRAPEDVGFAHLDWDASMEGQAGVNQRNELVGSAAVDLLTAHLHRNEFGVPTCPKTVLIEGVWVPGKSAPGQ